MKEVKMRAWNLATGMLYFELTVAHGIRLVSEKDLQQHGASDDQYIFMECSGIEDKDGRSIYDGDIVEVQYPSGVSRRTIVKKEEGCFYPFNGNDCGDCSLKCSWLQDIESIQVIGNIYEQGELVVTCKGQ